MTISPERVRGWIEAEQVPYVERDGEYRIPVGGLISALPSLFDLAGALERLERRAERG